MHHCFVYQLQHEHSPSLISVSCYNRDVKKTAGIQRKQHHPVTTFAFDTKTLT